MSEDIWFEDALLPPQELLEDTAKGLESLDERHLAAEKGLDLTALQQAESKGAALEQELNERVYRLFDLTAEETALIEKSLRRQTAR